jgi:hypothetical protein
MPRTTAGSKAVPPLWCLGRALVDPVAANIPEGTERIFVVPPAALAEVPFEALRAAPSVADSAMSRPLSPAERAGGRDGACPLPFEHAQMEPRTIDLIG